MTPERKEEHMDFISKFGKLPGHMALELLAALEETEQQQIKYKTEAERLNEICKQLAGEEMLFQDGGYETEMQRLWNRLAEAQQTIVRQREALESIYEESEDQGARACAATALGIKVEENQ